MHLEMATLMPSHQRRESSIGGLSLLALEPCSKTTPPIIFGFQDQKRYPWISLLWRQSRPSTDSIPSGFLLELFALSGLGLHTRGPGHKSLRGDRKAQTSPWYHPNAFGPLHRDLRLSLKKFSKVADRDLLKMLRRLSRGKGVIQWCLSPPKPIKLSFKR